MNFNQKNTIIKFALFLTVLFSFTGVRAQFFNKEIKAVIKVERNSEFYTFKATVENITPGDRENLRYEYLAFRTDAENKTEKQSRGDRFIIRANDIIILADLAINFNVEGKIVIVLLVYDENDKPIGKDRVVLPNGGKSEVQYDNPPTVARSEDQARPNDGVFFEGFVIENTITKAGRDFHRFFTQEKFNRGVTTSKNIVITETPARGRTTRIQVTIDDKLIWQFFTQPRKEFLKDQAITTLERSIRHLQNLQRRSQQLTRY